MNDRRPRLTYANVMSTLAVFLALAGGSALAAGLAKNSVSSKTVKNGSLKSIDLADGKGVSGADFADGSLSGADLGDGSLGAADLADGSVTGAKVADGSIGAADIGKGAIGAANIAPDTVLGSASFRDGGLRGPDVGDNALTGASIDESTLEGVQEATAVGRPASELLSRMVYEESSNIETGGAQPDGTFKMIQRCRGNDVLISGGAADTGAETSIVESRLLLDSNPRFWAVTVKPDPFGDGFPNGPLGDKFSVHVICLTRLGP